MVGTGEHLIDSRSCGHCPVPVLGRHAGNVSGVHQGAAGDRCATGQGDALRDQRIKPKRVDDYQNGNVRMGEDLHELRSVVGPLPDKIVALEQRDPSSLSFAQAAKLVGMGASVDELTQSCGLTQAELMRKLHRS
jgi:hypothetical protein